MADYVLALLRHDGDDETIRALCESEIPDFLKEDSALFVRDVFDAVNYKTYLPGVNPPRKPPLPFDPPTGPSALQNKSFILGSAVGSSGGNKKRTFNDRGAGQIHERGALPNSYLNEPNKLPRRSGPSIGRSATEGSKTGPTGTRPSLTNHQTMPSQYSDIQGISNSPSSLPTFDPNDPIIAMLAMQALGFPLPGTPGFNQAEISTLSDTSMSTSNQRCRDYDVKGYCARGITCTYEHGENPIWGLPQQKNNSEEYDPTNSILTAIDFNGSDKQGNSMATKENESSRLNSDGKRKGKPRRGDARNLCTPVKRGGRSQFSSDRPNIDKTKSTIVVENIPDEKFTEEEIRGFFSEFGNITDISLRQYKRLAIIKYDSWDSANLAYKSPKVIFDNRFVKVYWFQEQKSQSTVPTGSELDASSHPPTTVGTSMSTTDKSDLKIDLEEFSRKQKEAQEAFLEKKNKMLEMEAAKKELEKRQEFLLKCQTEEKRKLMERIAAKNGKPEIGAKTKENYFESEKARSQTEILKAQLAALEAEAQSLGIDTSLSDTAPWPPRGRGRARGQYRSRGGYRGRGVNHFTSMFVPGSRSFNLDNRTRKIAMTGVDFSDAEKDESLKQYLLVSAYLPKSFNVY